MREIGSMGSIMGGASLNGRMEVYTMGSGWMVKGLDMANSQGPAG